MWQPPQQGQTGQSGSSFAQPYQQPQGYPPQPQQQQYQGQPQQYQQARPPQPYQGQPQPYQQSYGAQPPRPSSYQPQGQQPSPALSYANSRPPPQQPARPPPQGQYQPQQYQQPQQQRAPYPPQNPAYANSSQYLQGQNQQGVMSDYPSSSQGAGGLAPPQPPQVPPLRNYGAQHGAPQPPASGTVQVPIAPPGGQGYGYNAAAPRPIMPPSGTVQVPISMYASNLGQGAMVPAPAPVPSLYTSTQGMPTQSFYSSHNGFPAPAPAPTQMSLYSSHNGFPTPQPAQQSLYSSHNGFPMAPVPQPAQQMSLYSSNNGFPTVASGTVQVANVPGQSLYSSNNGFPTSIVPSGNLPYPQQQQPFQSIVPSGNLQGVSLYSSQQGVSLFSSNQGLPQQGESSLYSSQQGMPASQPLYSSTGGYPSASQQQVSQPSSQPRASFVQTASGQYTSIRNVSSTATRQTASPPRNQQPQQGSYPPPTQGSYPPTGYPPSSPPASSQGYYQPEPPMQMQIPPPVPQRKIRATVGLMIWPSKKGAVVITGFKEGTDAETSGLEAGDSIETLDGMPMQGKKAEEVAKLLEGEGGSHVTIVTAKGHSARLLRDVPTEEAQEESQDAIDNAMSPTADRSGRVLSEQECRTFGVPSGTVWNASATSTSTRTSTTSTSTSYAHTNGTSEGASAAYQAQQKALGQAYAQQQQRSGTQQQQLRPRASASARYLQGQTSANTSSAMQQAHHSANGTSGEASGRLLTQQECQAMGVPYGARMKATTNVASAPTSNGSYSGGGGYAQSNNYSASNGYSGGNDFSASNSHSSSNNYSAPSPPRERNDDIIEMMKGVMGTQC